MDGQQAEEIKKDEPIKDSSGDNAYSLQHDRPNCIGCAACEAVSPKFWEMNPDGKSDIKGGKNRGDGWQELDFEDKEFQINKDAAESCPVNVIHIVDKKTGKKVI